MIRSFKGKSVKVIYEGGTVLKWTAIRKQIEKRLHVLDVATTLDDLRNLPSNRFEALRGKRAGQYSIRVNNQWRICFRWIDDEAHDVEIVDYH